MCGENSDGKKTSSNHLGSPPHVRGKLYEHPDVSILRKDHPRMCGENTDSRVLNLLKLGSPPHVRGKFQRFYIFNRIFRITPACAGKILKRSHNNAIGKFLTLIFHSVSKKPYKVFLRQPSPDVDFQKVSHNIQPVFRVYNL